jgi:hypothetical protein
MKLNIQGKTALITGAGRGLGEGICHSLAAEGARIVACSRTESDLKTLVGNLQPGQEHRYIPLDLAEPEGVSKLTQFIQDQNLTLDIFEYAGWDDPAKLICDFASQPQCPVSKTQAEAFGAQLAAWWPEAQSRAALLLPLHRLKWCCILLNEFRAQDRQRRYHAGDDQAERLETQLHKAQAYFDQHCQLD